MSFLWIRLKFVVYVMQNMLLMNVNVWVWLNCQLQIWQQKKITLGKGWILHSKVKIDLCHLGGIFHIHNQWVHFDHGCHQIRIGFRILREYHLISGVLNNKLIGTKIKINLARIIIIKIIRIKTNKGDFKEINKYQLRISKFPSK